MFVEQGSQMNHSPPIQFRIVLLSFQVGPICPKFKPFTLFKISDLSNHDKKLSDFSYNVTDLYKLDYFGDD